MKVTFIFSYGDREIASYEHEVENERASTQAFEKAFSTFYQDHPSGKYDRIAIYYGVNPNA